MFSKHEFKMIMFEEVCFLRRRKWTRRHEFKSWTRLIAFHIALIPFGKGINLIILPPTIGK